MADAIVFTYLVINTEGAESIVLSGGYEDDNDFGDTIIYTGHGGRDPESETQIEDQELTRGNLALVLSQMNGYPIRVIRGANHSSKFSPKSGYRYDGLYLVEDHWREIGKSGYYIWRYRLVKIQEKENLPPSRQGLTDHDSKLTGTPARVEITVQRIVRDTSQTRKVKISHDYRCQVCNIRLETAAGPYAEAAHIRPLGQPHSGPDTADNIICLCPNHHVLFDHGAFSIADNGEFIGLPGRLVRIPEHRINPEHLRYHREHYFNSKRNV